MSIIVITGGSRGIVAAVCEPVHLPGYISCDLHNPNRGKSSAVS